MIYGPAPIGISDALQSLRPGAQWALEGTEYASLRWLDAVQTQPTEQEVIDEIHRLNDVATTEGARITAVENDTGLRDLLTRIKTATREQWQDYLAANVTDLASARVVLYRMGLLLMLMSRKAL